MGKEDEDVTPCGFERRGEQLGKAGCVLKATTTTTKPANDGGHDTTTTKPANDGGHDYDKKEEARKEASGGKT